jgi:hypothetical protein
LNYQALNNEILKCCPDLTANEAVDAGKSLVALLKILQEAAQENPELNGELNVFMEGDFINEDK